MLIAVLLASAAGCGRTEGASPSPNTDAPWAWSSETVGAETLSPAQTGGPDATWEPIVSPPNEKGFSTHTLVFPGNMAGKTELNSSVYDIEPFRLSFELPGGWYCLAHPTVHEMYLGAWDGSETGVGVVYSIYWIYDTDNVCVGAVGYDLYRPIEGREDDPDFIYSAINGDDDYRFATKEYYYPVSGGTDTVTALTQVFISSEWIKKYGVQNASDRLHTGIVSYNAGCGAYTAFHLFPATLTATELIELAASIRFESLGG